MTLALKVALLPLLVAQGVWTRRRVPRLPEAAGERSGSVGDGARLRLLIVGDSSAAGVGVEHQSQAFAGYLTRRLAGRSRMQVHWQLVARSGVTTEQAVELLRGAAPAPVDAAVVVLGVNDVIEQVPTHRADAARSALVDWLRGPGGARHVAFAPLPPVHQFPALPQPLRYVAGREAQRHDRALARWADGRNAVAHVPVAIDLRPDMMASDGFHPGEPVYRICGEAIADHLAAYFAGALPAATADLNRTESKETV
jgi:lysophospholipase L1-like esterase